MFRPSQNRWVIQKKNNKNICDVVKVCNMCCKRINIYKSKHECGINWCNLCREKHDVNQLCYIQPIGRNVNAQINCKSPKKNLFIFYDFETRQDSAYREHAQIKIHIPNLCVVQQVCDDCMDNENINILCHTYGVREHIFRDDSVRQLIGLTVREKTTFGQLICIAHNSRGFDAQFILREIVENTSIVPNVILNGQNIIMLQCGRTKFIDSLNYFHMKLSALTQTFSLPPASKKGYFPHLFNTLENQNYVGALPEASFYAPNAMSTSEREKFIAWYEENRNTYGFDFQREILDYCRMDVEILRLACMAFRKIFIKCGNTCPFTEATTIASACSIVYRKNFLREKTIGIIPAGGYRHADNHSQKSIQWLLQCEREIGREIIHAGRAREFMLPEGFLIDGYLPPENDNAKGIVFEYQGCYYTVALFALINEIK
ncbi:probable DNA polymerase isoform X1 [Nasonia vitripennis]|uniref:DNA-directed DNA polymerase n=1 Tax=Nasonia vitripennis TaxID=7425 RepID=A0A7M7QLA5_NASVI|nr:probable DNA polymerase isoform X1 [Nasonia vitripennis]